MDNEARVRIAQLEDHIEALELVIEALIASHPLPAGLQQMWKHLYTGRRALQGLAEMTGKGRRPAFLAVLDSLNRKVLSPTTVPPKSGA